MNTYRNRMPALIYFLIALLAIVYTWYSFNFHPEREFNGVWTILITLPFSLLRIFFKSSEYLGNSVSNNVLLLQSVVYMMINTIIIYFITPKSKINGQ